jgi:hypothetical protein
MHNAADAGVPAGTRPPERLTAAAPVTGPEGNGRTARSAAEAGVHGTLGGAWRRMR